MCIMTIDYLTAIIYNGGITIIREVKYVYDEKAKARIMKYMHIKRESLQLNLPLGTKDLWKDYAADMGMSVTQLITKLIETDMKEHNWTETLNPYNMASKPKETDD